MCEKDYSLLRPFDKEIVKAGDALIYIYLPEAEFKFVAGPDSTGEFVFLNGDNIFVFARPALMRIAPLCWIEGMPVYPDSILYGQNTGRQYLGKEIGVEDFYTWKKPKQKKKAWINLYPANSGSVMIATSSNGFPTKYMADKHATKSRIACVQIEWEE